MTAPPRKPKGRRSGIRRGERPGADGLTSLDRAILARVALYGDSERDCALRLGCSVKQVWRSKQRAGAAAYILKLKTQAAAKRGEGPDALDVKALQARLEGRDADALELEAKAAALRDELARAAADPDMALPADDAERGFEGGYLVGAAGWIEYRRALLEARDQSIRGDSREYQERQTYLAAIQRMPRRRSWHRAAAIDLLARDAELKVRDGLGRYLLGRHAELWLPSRELVRECCERNGVAYTPESDAAVMAQFMELALRELCPEEPYGDVDELVPWSEVPVNLEHSILAAA